MSEIRRANNQSDPCNDTDCKYSAGGSRCCYGMRNSAGCYMEDRDKHDDMGESHASLALLKARIEHEPDLNTEEKESLQFVDKILSKSFRFLYKGHEYTVRDSARDQSTCPHCGHQTRDGLCWSEDDACYIGTYEDGPNKMVCFDCLECFKKFFYHGG